MKRIPVPRHTFGDRLRNARAVNRTMPEAEPEGVVGGVQGPWARARLLQQLWSSRLLLGDSASVRGLPSPVAGLQGNEALDGPFGVYCRRLAGQRGVVLVGGSGPHTLVSLCSGACKEVNNPPPPAPVR